MWIVLIPIIKAPTVQVIIRGRIAQPHRDSNQYPLKPLPKALPLELQLLPAWTNRTSHHVLLTKVHCSWLLNKFELLFKIECFIIMFGSSVTIQNLIEGQASSNKLLFNFGLLKKVAQAAQKKLPKRPNTETVLDFSRSGRKKRREEELFYWSGSWRQKVGLKRTQFPKNLVAQNVSQISYRKTSWCLVKNIFENNLIRLTSWCFRELFELWMNPQRCGTLNPSTLCSFSSALVS